MILRTAKALRPDLIVLGAPSPAHQEHDLEHKHVARVIASVSIPS